LKIHQKYYIYIYYWPQYKNTYKKILIFFKIYIYIFLKYIKKTEGIVACKLQTILECSTVVGRRPKMGFPKEVNVKTSDFE